MATATTTRKSTVPASTKAERTEAAAYTIHSLDEYKIDTRVTRLTALTEDEARNLTTEIQRTTARLWLLVTEAHDRKAHLALGYETWADYCKAELNMSESRSYQYLDTGHVMKALAATGVDIEAYAPPPTRVVARIKDRLTDVKKVATAALKESPEDPAKAVDKAIRTLAREPRKGDRADAGAASSNAGGGADITPPADADDATDTARHGRANGQVPCPACAGSGKVTQTTADRLLDLLKKLK